MKSRLDQVLSRLRCGTSRLRQRTTETGQALVEFALVLPIFLVLLFGLVDFGRAFHTWLLVTNAAREGARVGAVRGNTNDINTRINGSIGSLDTGALSIDLDNVQGTRGEAVSVHLEYDFEWVTPLGAFLPGGLADITIESTSTMRLE